jgi:hypothetical protein
VNNNSDVPDNDVQGDCKKPGCVNGEAKDVADDDKPSTDDAFCKKCENMELVADTNKNGFRAPSERQRGPSNRAVCCFDGDTVPVRQTDYDNLIAQCPQRTQRPKGERPHEVDGCSNSPDNLESWDNLPGTIDYDLYVTNPIWGTVLGEITEEQARAQTLPCNVHDICYQTCKSDKSACDNALSNAITDSCSISYPFECPQQVRQQNRCGEYEEELESCQGIGPIYLKGVKDLGGLAYRGRQKQYCDCCPP